MFRTFAFASIVFAAAACTNSQLDNNEVDDQPTADAKADGSFKPMRMGAYDVSFGDFFKMTLHDDGTFVLNGGCQPTTNGPECFAISFLDGNYHLTRSGSTHYIRLYNSGGDLAFKFSYVVSGDESQTVKLVDTHDNSKSTASLEQADKSQEGEHCGGFVANAKQCADGLDCVNTQGCCDLPGTCEVSSN